MKKPLVAGVPGEVVVVAHRPFLVDVPAESPTETILLPPERPMLLPADLAERLAEEHPGDVELTRARNGYVPTYLPYDRDPSRRARRKGEGNGQAGD